MLLTAAALASAGMAACANLVGITDTEVTEDGGGDATAAAETGADARPKPDAGTPAEGGPGGDADATLPDGGGDVTVADARDTGARSDGPTASDADGGDGATADTGPAPSEGGAADASLDQGAPDSGTRGGGCAAPCPPNTPSCVSGQCLVRGPTMVAVTSFYVDSTEVTVAQYKQFLAATNNGTDTTGQPPECAWNTTYQSPMPMKPDTFPMTFIDWCDARAFCQWADKHLCGAIAGGPITFELSDGGFPVFTPSLSQWFLACGGPGGSPHPSNADMCNSNDGFGDLVPVGTMPGCEGYYPGLFDLEGNAAEWIDSCDGPIDAGPDGDSGTDGGPANDICHLMGGSFVDPKSYCDESYDTWPRNTTAVSFGFRCCGG